MARSSRRTSRSRAARRAGSPSMDFDRSLENIKPPPEGIDHRPSILAMHSRAGVSKKTKQKNVRSSRKRRRQERGVARAELAMAKLELKVAKSVGKSKTLEGRKVTWDELNTALPAANHGLRRRDQPRQDDIGWEDMEAEVELPAEAPADPADIAPQIAKIAAISLAVEDEVQEDEEEEL